MKKVLGAAALAILVGLVAGGTVLGVLKLTGSGSGIGTAAETQASETVSGEETAPETEAEKLEKAASETTEKKSEASSADKSKSSAASGAGSVRLDVSDIVEAAMPQVVSITNTMVVKQNGYSSIYDYFYGGGFGIREYEVPASGSGVILEKTDSELLIVTNNHVIEGAKTLSVTFIDGTTVDADVKGTDSTIDLAVIAIPLSSISEETLSKIQIAKLHDQEDLKVGEGVIAIGNSLGYGQTVTVGYISALGREIQAESTVYSDLIQTDAAINPGNSGGALINMDGEVIGINVAKLSETSVEGVGYSIPIYKAKEVIDNLAVAKTKKEVPESNQGRLGIYMNTVSAANAKALGIPAGVIIKGFSDELIEGYTEADVMESPAKEAGLVKNDIITHFDGQKVESAEALGALVKYYEAGSEVEVKVQRLVNGSYVEKSIKITLGKKNDKNIRPVETEENKEEAASEKQSEDSRDRGSRDRNSRKDDGKNSEEKNSEEKNSEGRNYEEYSSEDDVYELFQKFLERYQ